MDELPEERCVTLGLIDLPNELQASFVSCNTTFRSDVSAVPDGTAAPRGPRTRGSRGRARRLGPPIVPYKQQNVRSRAPWVAATSQGIAGCRAGERSGAGR